VLLFLLRSLVTLVFTWRILFMTFLIIFLVSNAIGFTLGKLFYLNLFKINTLHVTVINIDRFVLWIGLDKKFLFFTVFGERYFLQVAFL